MLFEPSPQLLEAKTDYLHFLNAALRTRGMIKSEVFFDVNSGDIINFRITGDFPVSLTIYEEYGWEAKPNLETSQILAGHTATSIAAWVSILEVASNNLAYDRAFAEFSILAATACPPSISVNLAVRASSAAHHFISTSRLVRLNNHEYLRRNDWTFQAVRFVYHIYNGRIQMSLSPCDIAVVNGSVVGGHSYHIEQVDEARDLISQDDNFFTAWAERNHLFIALCNAHGAMEAHRDHIIFEPTG